MNFEYNIIKDNYNFTDVWDKFSQTISDEWDWDNDDLSQTIIKIISISV